MITKIVLSFTFCLFVLKGIGQLSVSNELSLKIDVNQIFSCNWNTENGISYSQVPGANLGVASFEFIDNNEISFLCNSTSEILIFNISERKLKSKFSVAFAPRDFAFENKLFYVLYENHVAVYNLYGNEINKYLIPELYLGCERIERYNNETYLLLPSGNSLMIESSGKPCVAKEYEGWITKSGNFVKTNIKENNYFEIIVKNENKESLKNKYYSSNKLAGVYIAGISKNLIILDVQIFISENPICVERKIVCIELSKSGLGEIISEIKIPDVYYVLSNKEFVLSSSGILYNMVSAPKGVFVFALTETKKKEVNPFPKFLTENKYHFNDHLLKVEE